MTKHAMLKATLPTLRMLDRALSGYTLPEDGSCYLLFSGGSVMKVSAEGVDVAPRFECFSLAMEASEKPAGIINVFAPQEGCVATSVLVREEFIEPLMGDSSGLLGSPPHTFHSATRPGHVPEHALNSCLVAYGILFDSGQDRLAIVADWSPYTIVATTDETQIAVL